MISQYSTRFRTYIRKSDDSTEGSVDWDAVEGGDETHQHPHGPQEGRSTRDGSVEWYDSGESSHDSGLYVPPGRSLEQTYGHILVQDMLDHLP
jgi:hypothetical protein